MRPRAARRGSPRGPTPPAPNDHDRAARRRRGTVQHRADPGRDGASDDRGDGKRGVVADPDAARLGHDGALGERREERVVVDRPAVEREPRRPVEERAREQRRAGHVARASAGRSCSAGTARTKGATRARHGRPARRMSTPGPTRSTTPAPSWPRTAGSGLGVSPVTVFQSLRHTPLASAAAPRPRPGRAGPGRAPRSRTACGAREGRRRASRLGLYHRGMLRDEAARAPVEYHQVLCPPVPEPGLPRSGRAGERLGRAMGVARRGRRAQGRAHAPPGRRARPDPRATRGTRAPRRWSTRPAAGTGPTARRPTSTVVHAQHGGLVEALEAEGVDVHFADPLPGPLHEGDLHARPARVGSRRRRDRPDGAAHAPRRGGER